MEETRVLVIKGDPETLDEFASLIDVTAKLNGYPDPAWMGWNEDGVLVPISNG